MLTYRPLAFVIAAFAAAVPTSGCIVDGHAGVVAHAHFDAPPTLVEIEPGVWVVADYPYAVYYVDGYYWRYEAGVWYTAHHWSDDWAVVSVNLVPVHLIGLDHHAYVHYQAKAGAHVRTAPPAHAAQPHGGPPGQRDVPGLRRGHDQSTPHFGSKSSEHRRDDDRDARKKRDKKHDKKRNKKRRRRKHGPKPH